MPRAGSDKETLLVIRKSQRYKKRISRKTRDNGSFAHGPHEHTERRRQKDHMNKFLSQYPLAPESLERDAKNCLPYRTMTPEEYAVKDGDRWACFSFGEYRYRDPVLDRWVHALDDIVFNPDRLKQVKDEHAQAGVDRL